MYYPSSDYWKPSPLYHLAHPDSVFAMEDGHTVLPHMLLPHDSQQWWSGELGSHPQSGGDLCACQCRGKKTRITAIMAKKW